MQEQTPSVLWRLFADLSYSKQAFPTTIVQSILTVLVGSRAHGLHTDTSDYDWRGVFVVPTMDLLAIDGSPKTTSWIEGKDGEKVDDTSWELSHFCKLAMQCNPTILEALLAPPNDEKTTDEGMRLRALFPSFLSKKRVFDAFTGYAKNQEKKMLDRQLTRPAKFMAAYLRTLYNATELLETGTFTVRIADVPTIGEQVRRAKEGGMSEGEAIDLALELRKRAEAALAVSALPERADIGAINAYVRSVRLAHFDTAA